MPRQNRVFIEGGIYHVYNRAAHGTALFDSPKTSEKFVEILANVLRRDQHTSFAWTLLCNHYHVVVRTSATSLTRTFGRIQASFGTWRNRQIGSRGRNWQNRFQAKLVTTNEYLMQVIAYVHLNPVTAGLVHDPAEHSMSGHREILGLADHRLVDVDEVLRIYGDQKSTAISNYVASIGAFMESEEWIGDSLRVLPWWQSQPDQDLGDSTSTPALGADGRPFREPRPVLEPHEFFEAACCVLNIGRETLDSRTRRWEVSRKRIMIVGLGVERWKQKATHVARELERTPEFVSWSAKRAAELRADDKEFDLAFCELDEAIRCRYE